MKSLADRAYEYTAAIAEGIGPRPAGSPAESAAFDAIAAKLGLWGYTLERTPVPFAPHTRLGPPLLLSALLALLLMASGWLLQPFPLAVLLLPLLLALRPGLARWLRRHMPRTRQSQNLLARRGAASNGPRLILCAHVDSGSASVFTSPLWLNLRRQRAFILQRTAIALAALAITSWIGLPLPPWLLAAAQIAGLALGLGWLGLELAEAAGPQQAAPGAFDNASGVGVLLALAEHLSGHSAEKLNVEFLFTGAEETGLHGAEAAARGLSPAPDLAVINLDMVGAGSGLAYVIRDGVLNPRPTDPALNELILQADPQVQDIWYTQRSSDYLPFLERGIRAASLQSVGSEAAELAYHTRRDTLAVIEKEALGRTAQTVLRVIQAGYLGQVKS